MENRQVYNEKELLQRIAQGDEHAFEDLFHYYYKSLYSKAPFQNPSVPGNTAMATKDLLGITPGDLNGNTSTILNNVYRAVDMNLNGTVRASAGSNVNDYLVLMSPGILNGNTSNILTQH